ncbi:hypothetical protein GGD62_004202 [Bradyrhizobium sp. ERR14]|nr:hypothetical protein [Bradyrhizobium sp. ERR14]
MPKTTNDRIVTNRLSLALGLPRTTGAKVLKLPARRAVSRGGAAISFRVAPLAPVDASAISATPNVAT